MPILYLASTPQDSLLKYIQFRLCSAVNTRFDLAFTVKEASTDVQVHVALMGLKSI
jgi:hypothetical protein